MMPERYRLDMSSMGVIMDQYAKYVSSFLPFHLYLPTRSLYLIPSTPAIRTDADSRSFALQPTRRTVRPRNREQGS